jgi:hypothetical protein
MKILLAITSVITLIAILEAAGVVDWIDKDTVVLKGYCDNTSRELDKGMPGGGMGVDSPTTVKHLETAYGRINGSTDIKLKYEYFLSKNALDALFNRDYSATGIFISPIFESDNGDVNILVGASHSKNTITEGGSDFAYVVRTFCPDMCEVIRRTLPAGSATGTP